MNTYKYSCLETDCENKEFQYVQADHDPVVSNTPEPCATCGKPMKLLGQVSSVGIARLSAASPAEKQKALLQRSSQHFKKHIQGRKQELNQQFEAEARERFGIKLKTKK